MSFFKDNLADFKTFNSKIYTFSSSAFSAKTTWCRFSNCINGYYVRDGQYLVDCHKHTTPELIFSLHGVLGYTDSHGNELYIPAGYFALFPAGFLHRQFYYKDSYSFGAAFDIQFADTPEGAYLARCFLTAPFLHLKASEQLLRILEQLSAEVVDQRACTDLTVGNLLSSMVIEVARIIDPRFESAEEHPNMKDARAEELVLFIRANLAAHLTQKDFEVNFGMSIKQLNRIMRRYYDLSVFGFLRKERIRKAKKLLEKSGIPLKEIAHQVGYSDEFAMSKAFKQIEGMSPSRYRLSYHHFNT